MDAAEAAGGQDQALTAAAFTQFNIPVGEDGQAADQKRKALEQIQRQHFQCASDAQQKAVEPVPRAGGPSQR